MSSSDRPSTVKSIDHVTIHKLLLTQCQQISTRLRVYGVLKGFPRIPFFLRRVFPGSSCHQRDIERAKTAIDGASHLNGEERLPSRTLSTFYQIGKQRRLQTTGNIKQMTICPTDGPTATKDHAFGWQASVLAATPTRVSSTLCASSMTMTMTMTHSNEVTNGSQKPETRLLNPRSQLKSVANSFANRVYAHQASRDSIPIKISLVLGGWPRNVRHLAVIQLHGVHVASGSNWILRRTSSAVHTVNRCCDCCRCVFTSNCFSRFLATLIHVLLFFISLPFIFSVSSDQERLGACLAPQAKKALWYMLLQLHFHFLFLSVFLNFSPH